MNKIQSIAHKLRLLQDNLREIASDMEYYGDCDTDMQYVKSRLLLQAAQVEMWADNIDEISK